MAFWWASQGKNHSIAIEQGTLWTCPWPDGRLRTDRILIKKIQPGDTIIHYANGMVRAVSQAVAEWTPAARPVGYPKLSAQDPDAGWLVRVQPIATGLNLDFRELPSLITVGAPGPLDKDGSPQQKYLSVISDEDGQRVLDRLGLSGGALPATLEERTTIDEIWDHGETDATVIGRRRREQGHLRAYLLNNRTTAPCALCSRELPSTLLVAAHITPRAVTDEDHRKDFAAIAMLACTLGCDSLFELGYLTVTPTGTITAGRTPTTDAVRDVVKTLAGATCVAHNTKTAPSFAKHASLVTA